MPSIAKFKTDKNLEQDGVWVDVGEGLQLRIARSNSPKFEAHLRKIGRPYARQMRHGTLDNETLQDLTKRAMARHVLLGWKNLQDENGEDIPYSEEASLKLLREYPDFFRMVADFAEDRALFKHEDDEEALGNSANASDGS